MDVSLFMPVEWGNLLVWLVMEIFVLAALIFWTSSIARIILRHKRAAKEAEEAEYVESYASQPKKKRRQFVDMLPMNSDVLNLPLISKLFITLLRLCIVVLVAISGIGIDRSAVFLQNEPTTHAVVANNKTFAGRSFRALGGELLQDVAVAACEDVNSFSVIKYYAFVSASQISCNSGNVKDTRIPVVEVIWRREIVQEILDAEPLDVNVRLGDSSKLNKQESNATFFALEHTDGIPVQMYLARRRLTHAVYGECDSDEREYLIVSNAPMVQLVNTYVGAAFVICNPKSTVYLRNTDQMMHLPDFSASQQITIARRVSESLISIVPDKRSTLYFGKTRQTTVIQLQYGILMLALIITNSTLAIIVSLYWFFTVMRPYQ